MGLSWARSIKGLGSWLLYAFFWVVWKERNSITFDNEVLQLIG